jgi:hypothetical protein
MAYRWPEDTDFALWELDVLDRDCSVCGRLMHICDYRYRRLHTLDGPVQLACKLNRCPDPACPGHAKTKSPEREVTIALPQMAIGWDVLCWIGHRRCSRHMAVSLIRSELLDDYQIKLSADAIEQYIRRYQSATEIILCIDGIQPEKGHETLYVVRELTRKRVWFAEPLLSATQDEIRRLIQQAKEWAERLEVPVGLWMSDRQDAFVKTIAVEFPEVPHRYCDNHFLRDLAKPVLEPDSHAKVQMRKKVRGLRAIEQTALQRQKARTKEDHTPETAEPASTAPAVASAPSPEVDAAGSLVLDYCAAVRGILNNDQGGPLEPPGLQMAEALSEVQESIERNLAAKKGDSQGSNSPGCRAASRRVSTKSKTSRR